MSIGKDKHKHYFKGNKNDMNLINFIEGFLDAVELRYKLVICHSGIGLLQLTGTRKPFGIRITKTARTQVLLTCLCLYYRRYGLPCA